MDSFLPTLPAELRLVEATTRFAGTQPETLQTSLLMQISECFKQRRGLRFLSATGGQDRPAKLLLRL